MLKGEKRENITETHQNKAQKAKITTQKASERVSTVLKGQKSENNNPKSFREGSCCVKWAKKRKLEVKQSISNIDIIYMT